MNTEQQQNIVSALEKTAFGRIPIVASISIVAGVMLSRLYLGVHYLVDVLGGVLIGLILVVAYQRLWPVILLENFMSCISPGLYMQTFFGLLAKFRVVWQINERCDHHLLDIMLYLKKLLFSQFNKHLYL